MQTLESGEEFWRILSDQPFEKVKADDEERQRLAAALFFHPNQSVQRVVTIGTPHRGSDYSNDYTQWLGRKLIRLPTSLTEMGNSLIRQNPSVFRDTELLLTKTSIDSLSPDSPIFPTMLRARRAPWVHYHNIIGILEKSKWFHSNAPDSDGVVTVDSAHIDDVDSEVVVSSSHSMIHSTPRAILEVRRILVEHLRDVCHKPEIASLLEVPDTWKDSSYGQPIHPAPIISTQMAKSNDARSSLSNPAWSNPAWSNPAASLPTTGNPLPPGIQLPLAPSSLAPYSLAPQNSGIFSPLAPTVLTR
jgi:hypothetical protein